MGQALAVRAQRVGRTGQLLHQAKILRAVSSQLRTIATASTRQSASLTEVEANMESLQAITRDNAELVEQSNAAAQVLVNLGKALAEFNASPKSWIDRDLFIFCLDRSGIILADAMTPSRVGLSVDTLAGLRGTHHSERLWECVQQQGSGWLRYPIAHPVTGAPRFKETFVTRIDDTTLLGCGCHASSSSELDAETNAPRAVAWSRKGENLVAA
jgi:signal transduction histidine kinase